jgi:hypothetical protein
MRAFLLLLLFLSATAARAQQMDVVVYGATPAGIAAALAAAQDGEKVLLVEPSTRIGGMSTNGLSHPDFRTFEGLSGTFLKFTRRVLEHYRPEFGAETEKVTFRGTHAEPKAILAIFEQMLAEQPNITLKLSWMLENVQVSSEAQGDVAGPMKALEVALFADPKGDRHSIPARYFIDATYEGDLMAAAGIPYHVGREGKAEYHEALAPDEADNQLQAYNFRLIMTQDPANRVTPKAPRGYRRDDFAGVLPLLENGTIKTVFGTKPDAIYKTQVPLPHGKHDINDMSRGPVRLSLPGKNDEWPDGGGGVAIRGGATEALDRPPFSRLMLATARQRVFTEHVRWDVGLLYFLQNDEAVPEKIREEARTWGWCRDEFLENAHLPEQLYVREARRMIGRYIYTQGDVAAVPGDVRGPLHRQAIAVGDYGLNCHGTGHEGSMFGGKHTGEFYQRVPPYQVPFDVLVPRQMENLLVPGAMSASHVGLCTLRYEPIWMALGEAAGHAVHLARAAKVPLQQLPVERLQRRLHEAGCATIYVSDVPPGHPLFAAVQWWATAGGLHGLWDGTTEGGTRGKNIQGQYYEAYPNHAAELDRAMDAGLLGRWRKMAATLGLTEKLPADEAGGKMKRGEWIAAVWKAAQK